MRVPVLICLLAGAAGAQTLDFTPPPVPRTGSASVAIIDRLDQELDALRSAGRDPATAASIEWRRLARALAAPALTHAERAPERTLLAWTIARRAREFDRTARSVSDPRLLDALARDLRGLVRDPPPTPEQADRALRDALAMLSHAVLPPGARGGWIETEPPPAVHGAALRAALALVPGLDARAAGAAGEAIDAIEASRGWNAYARSGEQMAAHLHTAFSAVAADRPWLAESARHALISALDRALQPLGTPGGVPEAKARLVRIARVGRVLDAGDALTPGPEAQSFRDALSTAIAPLLEGSRAAGSLSHLERALALASPLPTSRHERALVAPVRPAWRQLHARAERTRDALVRSLPAIATREEGASDPGIIAALASHQRSLERLGAIDRLSALLAGDEGAGPSDPAREPRVAERYALFARRFLEATRRLGETDPRFTIIDALARDLPALTRIDGEERLRAAAAQDDPDAFPARATGHREGQLLTTIDRARAERVRAWEDALAQNAPPPPDDRLTAIETLVPLLMAGDEADRLRRELADFDAPRPPLQAWPGWELSAEALGELLRGIEEALAEVTRLLVAGEGGAAREAAARARARYAGAILAGRLGSEARALGLGTPGGAPEAGFLAELGFGPPWTPGEPIESWMARARDALAEFCTVSEEVPAARALGEGDRAGALRAHANALALEILQRREARAPAFP